MKLRTAAFVSALFLASSVFAQQSPGPTAPLENIAKTSLCRRESGAPPAYVAGLALTFARALCQPDRPDVKVISTAAGDPATARGKMDGLTVFDGWFKGQKMANDKDGVDSLRHTYVLLLALGLVESSGRYCTGRDQSENFKEADSAESGLIQTSWGARKSNPTLEPMFRNYQAQHDAARCMFEVFSHGISCPKHDADNFGDPNLDGFQWQALTKQCPAFSAEYGAVVLRTHGGNKGEFGTINCYVSPHRLPNGKPCDKPTPHKECDAMFREVQDFVSKNPSICDAVK